MTVFAGLLETGSVTREGSVDLGNVNTCDSCLLLPLPLPDAWKRVVRCRTAQPLPRCRKRRESREVRASIRECVSSARVDRCRCCPSANIPGDPERRRAPSDVARLSPASLHGIERVNFPRYNIDRPTHVAPCRGE